jgi:hypothetical protein
VRIRAAKTPSPAVHSEEEDKVNTQTSASADVRMEYESERKGEQDEAGPSPEQLVSPERPLEEQELDDQLIDDENPELVDGSQLQNRKKRRTRNEPLAPVNGQDQNQ